jgi:hypothetical protein
VNLTELADLPAGLGERFQQIAAPVADFPDLSRDDIRACLAFAAARISSESACCRRSADPGVRPRPQDESSFLILSLSSLSV